MILTVYFFSCKGNTDSSAPSDEKIDYSVAVLGDFILNDGTICSPDDYDITKNNAVAVIVRAAAGNVPALGIGLVQTPQNGLLCWCETGSKGSNLEIEDLKGDINKGFTDGSNGWEILKAHCSDAEDSPQKYPAWNFCLTYGEKNNLSDALADGWYLPTINELKIIYDNKSIINESFIKAGVDSIYSGNYWSSCQGKATDSAMSLYISPAESASCKTESLSKTTNKFYVCAVHIF